MRRKILTDIAICLVVFVTTYILVTIFRNQYL